MEPWKVALGVFLNYVTATGIIFFIRYLYETGFTYGNVDCSSMHFRSHVYYSGFADRFPLCHDLAGYRILRGNGVVENEKN